MGAAWPELQHQCQWPKVVARPAGPGGSQGPLSGGVQRSGWVGAARMPHPSHSAWTRGRGRRSRKEPSSAPCSSTAARPAALHVPGSTDVGEVGQGARIKPVSLRFRPALVLASTLTSGPAHDHGNRAARTGVGNSWLPPRRRPGSQQCEGHSSPSACLPSPPEGTSGSTHTISPVVSSPPWPCPLSCGHRLRGPAPGTHPRRHPLRGSGWGSAQPRWSGRGIYLEASAHRTDGKECRGGPGLGAPHLPRLARGWA